MEIFIWSFALCAYLCALTPIGIMVHAVPKLRDHEPNTLSIALASVMIMWTYAMLLAVFIPYADIGSSQASAIGIGLAVSFGAAFFVSAAVLIPFAESEDAMANDWSDM